MKPGPAELLALKSHTTLRVGGDAARLMKIQSGSEMLRALDSPSLFLLGGGSNLVVHDAGWPGVVAQMAIRGVAWDDSGRVYAEAGEPWDDFVRLCAEQGWGGIECLAGIPGTVGATPIQNVGAYGQEVSDTIVEVQALDRSTGEIVTLTATECHFGYRASRFNTTEIGRWIILGVTFQLTRNATPTLKYRDLAAHFGDGATPSLLETYHAVREIRGRKGMVVDPSDPDSRSAGSFFKNPVVAEKNVPPEAPTFPAAPGLAKVPAAWLIEKSGLLKGQKLVGGIGISSKHPLALVNQNNGTASDVAASAKLVQNQVFELFGINLHPEPLFVGPWTPDELPEGATIVLP
jgi:UDP-N-acetylmuramate dehydrogenase